MPPCVFCKIVKKEIPAEIIYEDDNFLAFLDINPRSPGHCQIISKTHFRWVWDLPNAGEFFEVAKKVARAIQKAFNQPAVWSKIMGDEIKHAHIWIFPHLETAGDKNDLIGNAEKIRKILNLKTTSDDRNSSLG